MTKHEELSCGSCTSCCKTHAVFEIGKAAGRWCEHCDIGRGCNIYEKRPINCQKFRCEWLKGYGKRPDRTKVVLDFHTEGAMGEMLQMWEVSEGALERPYAEEITNECLSNNISVCRLYLDGRKEMIVPPDFVISPEVRAQLGKEGIKAFRARAVAITI